MSIGEAIQQIRDKTGIGGADFGIFQPKGKSKQSKSRWLKNDKSFMFYEIESEVSCVSFFSYIDIDSIGIQEETPAFEGQAFG